MDARLIDKGIARLLSRCKWDRFIRLSCDTAGSIPTVKKAIGLLKESGISAWRIFVYTLVQDVEEAHDRILEIASTGAQPFAQPYRDFDGGEPTKEQKRLARWCNKKEIFKTVKWEEYK